MKVNFRLLLIVQLFLVNSVFAQEVDNIRVDLRGDLILIMYDLKSTSAVSDYKIEIFGSHNNFKNPIVQVSGDVGSSVKPGLNKIISWASKSELKDYKGELIFEIAATPNLAVTQQPLLTQPEIQKSEQPVTALNIPRPDNYLSQLKSGKTISRITLVTGVAATGMGLYFKSAADQYYKQYQSATGQANDLRDKVELLDGLYPVTLAVGGVSLLTSVYFALKVQKQKRKWGLVAVPFRSGMQVAYHYNF
jgi:hypothetical protein